MLSLFRHWNWSFRRAHRKQAKSCVLFLTHKWSSDIAARFRRIEAELGHLADVFLLCDSRDGKLNLKLNGLNGLNVVRFNSRRLENKLKITCYEPGRLVPGSVHFPLLLFARRHHYNHYWLIENDVEFSGSWSVLLQACDNSEADLIAAHRREYQDAPDWILWPSLQAPGGAPLKVVDLYKAFMPIVRLSSRAVRAVENFHRAGWRGHAEVLIPTCLRQNGMEIVDFNSFAPFYRGHEQDPVEDRDALSTLRWRPLIDLNVEYHRGDNILYHPMK